MRKIYSKATNRSRDDIETPQQESEKKNYGNKRENKT